MFKQYFQTVSRTFIKLLSSLHWENDVPSRVYLAVTKSSSRVLLERQNLTQTRANSEDSRLEKSFVDTH